MLVNCSIASRQIQETIFEIRRRQFHDRLCCCKLSKVHKHEPRMHIYAKFICINNWLSANDEPCCVCMASTLGSWYLGSILRFCFCCAALVSRASYTAAYALARCKLCCSLLAGRRMPSGSFCNSCSLQAKCFTHEQCVLLTSHVCCLYHMRAAYITCMNTAAICGVVNA